MPTLRLSLRGLSAAALLAVAACSSGSPEAAATTGEPVATVHPESGLRVVPVTVTSGGKAHVFQAEVAATPREQAQGMMFRTAMGPDEAMIFPFPDARRRTFWMKNTVIPLDIIYIGSDRRILNVAANAVPYSEELVPSDGPAIAVLELNGGRAAQLGIAKGDKVEW
jgi:uncharacterized protein